MPKATKADTPVSLDVPEVEFRDAELGEYTASFAHYKVDADPAPLFRGLPDDRCQSPHWGYVLSGRITFRFADHDETYVAGDAFYAPPGHVPLCFGDTELVDFSLTEELARTNATVGRNMMAGVVPL